jgi:hypothetical protein
LKNFKIIVSIDEISLSKAQADNKWVNDVKIDLCRVLNERHQLVTIFKFDSKRHNGNLEDAILEALFNGNYSLLILFFSKDYSIF